MAILPPVTARDVVPMLPVMTAVMCKLTESLLKTLEETANANRLVREVHELKGKKEEANKNCLKKLNSTVTTLITAASEEDGRPAPNIPKSYKCFYNCESAGLADKEPTHQFKKSN